MVIVIGGGISGLYTCFQLLARDIKNIKLLEAKPYLGGALQTYYEQNKAVLEMGAWRVHATHLKLLELIQFFDLELEESTSGSGSKTKFTNFCQKNNLSNKEFEQNTIIPGLSEFDQLVLDEGTCKAKIEEYKSGYHGIFDMQNGSNAYDSSEEPQGPYFYLVKGYSELIKKITQFLEDNGVTILKNHLVNDVKFTNQSYSVYVTIRNKKEFNKKIFNSKVVFSAIPPNSIKKFNSVKQHLMPQLACVESHALHHIYASSNELKNTAFKITTDLPISQIISPNHNSSYFQISYSMDRSASFWQNLKLNDTNEFKKELDKQLHMVFNKLGIKIPTYQSVKSYFWPNAIHSWRASFLIKDDFRNMSKRTTVPHPLKCPNFYLVGEAFSILQGWTEGALINVNDALEFFDTKKYPLYKQPFNKDKVLFYDDRVLDVDKWKKVHPGSLKAIQSHLSESIEKYMEQYVHPQYAYAILWHLQISWNKK